MHDFTKCIKQQRIWLAETHYKAHQTRQTNVHPGRSMQDKNDHPTAAAATTRLLLLLMLLLLLLATSY